MRDNWMSASGQSQGKTVDKSPGLLIHCHGGGFVAQSSASHEVSGGHALCTIHVCNCRKPNGHVSAKRYNNM